MLSIFSYLITMFGFMFWFLRAIACLMASRQADFAIVPTNLYLEIALLFASLPCFALILKRNLIGATVYFGMYGAYFGTGLYNGLTKYIATEEFAVNNTAIVGDTLNLIVMGIGVVVPLLTFLDILINKSRTRFNGDKKTDWFFTNSQYDRQFDERADKNQYKF